MDAAAKLTTKGQVTLPKAVREALGLHDGDRVVFRVQGRYAVLARTVDLLELAGVVDVAPTERDADWQAIRDQTRRVRAAERGDR